MKSYYVSLSETIVKKYGASCPTSKQVIIGFSFSFFLFRFLFSQAISVIFSFFFTFLEKHIIQYHEGSAVSHPLYKVKPCSGEFLSSGFVITPFIFFFFFLSKAILVTAELPVSCYVFLSIFQQFCSNHFAMSAFIYEAFICNDF